MSHLEPLVLDVHQHCHSGENHDGIPSMCLHQQSGIQSGRRRAAHYRHRVPSLGYIETTCRAVPEGKLLSSIAHCLPKYRASFLASRRSFEAQQLCGHLIYACPLLSTLACYRFLMTLRRGPSLLVQTIAQLSKAEPCPMMSSHPRQRSLAHRRQRLIDLVLPRRSMTFRPRIAGVPTAVVSRVLIMTSRRSFQLSPRLQMQVVTKAWE